MKTINLLQTLAFAVFLIGFTACSSDDDADATIDPVACTEIAFFADTDGDGLGDATASQMACENEDLEGFVTNADDNDDSQALLALFTGTIENLAAPEIGGGPNPASGEFTKFDFETGAVTDSDTDWDIAFRGTAIAVNGGVQTGTDDEPVRNGDAGAAIVTGLFGDITTADGLTFEQDATTGYAITKVSDMGWYNYSGPPNFLITPIPGKILVFRTRDGRYAKVEIKSYYKDAPATPDAFTDEGQYFTFDYTYNPNTGLKTLE